MMRLAQAQENHGLCAVDVYSRLLRWLWCGVFGVDGCLLRWAKKRAVKKQLDLKQMKCSKAKHFVTENTHSTRRSGKRLCGEQQSGTTRSRALKTATLSGGSFITTSNASEGSLRINTRRLGRSIVYYGVVLGKYDC